MRCCHGHVVEREDILVLALTLPKGCEGGMPGIIGVAGVFCTVGVLGVIAGAGGEMTGG